MAASVDFSKLRNATLDSSQDEEAVTVNTRALIDKVLARYSGEWTTLRELIQNAADASASKVSIKFETLPSASVPLPQTSDRSAHLKHTILHHTLRSLKVSNNGQPFAETDWARLKRIAEGNPDETKIGAFGVGFYSVFAECEDPFVVSGDESMAFYWKGNSLFTRRGTVPTESASRDTTFVLDYRNKTTPVPGLMSICQFLSSSLTFVGLDSIELWLDDWNLFTLNKKSAPAADVPIPKDINTKTKEGTMKISAVSTQNAQIDATWTNAVGWLPTADALPPHDDDASSAPSLRSFFSRLTGSSASSAAAKKAAREEHAAQQAIAEDLTGKSQATVFIRISTVQIRTSITSSFAAELERATKKPPPKTTRIAILTSSYDEQAASMSTMQGTASRKVAEIITSVLPSKAGRVFIGFPTAQTTGLLAHISAPSLIPTVERENIDLNARYVRTWNQELLSVAGIACRIAYIGEMDLLRSRLDGARKSSGGSLAEADVKKAVPPAVHISKQYTFKESTPLGKVGSMIEEAFWTCQKRASIEVLSSQGVLPSHDVRIASEKLSFVQGIPVIPEQLLKEANAFISKLQDYNFITDITESDIARELERQALTEVQLEEFLKWAAKKARSELDSGVIQSLFSVTVASIEEEDGSARLLPLADLKAFINSSRITPDLPMPPWVVPFKFTKVVNTADLQNFGWEELQIVPWVRWLVDPATRKSLGTAKDISVSPAFSSQVLAVVSKAFGSLGQSSKQTVVDLLSPLTIIPTKQGMKKPVDAYFASVRLFDDLPTVSGLNGVKEQFLKALGLRKTIELSVIFDRLMNSRKDGQTTASWSHVDLIRYLVSVWSDIPTADIEQLRKTPLCPAQDASGKPTSERYKLSQLFEPKDSLRGLGLPLLQWPGDWNSFSNDGKFLRSLGLRPYPDVSEIIDLALKAAKDGEVSLYHRILMYFIESYYSNSYGAFPISEVQIPFLPLEGSEKLKLARPQDCFVEAGAAMLGFDILRQDLKPHASVLGVRQNPPINECAVRLIKNPPRDRQMAKSLFGYMGTRLADITPNVADRLGSAAIVPVAANGPSGLDKEKYRLAQPISCFLGDGLEYGEIFDYVNFSEQANVFLLKIGSKHEPSSIELTRHVVREPNRILQTLKVERYLGLLRKVHLNVSVLRKDKALWKEMKNAPFLLGYKEKTVRSDGDSKPSANVLSAFDGGEDDVDNVVKEWRLRSAAQLCIVDDLLSYSIFKDHMTAAPQEEPLEELYFTLGTPVVSSLVDQEHRLGPKTGDQRKADKMKELLLERARLFLHEQPTQATRHDIKWLEKNLEVQLVQSVSLRRTLKGTSMSHQERRTAAISDKSVLSYTADYEWFHISQEVVELIIDRPKTQMFMVFEMFCTTSLLKLRARGYNVDRILRRKEAEKNARIAEMEKHKEREDEQRRIRLEQERAALTPAVVARDMSDQRASQDEAAQPSMPGAFNDSPNRPNLPSTKQPLVAKNFFSSLKEKFGLDDGKSAAQSISKFFGDEQTGSASGDGGAIARPKEIRQDGALAPPPYSPYDPNQVKGQGKNEAVTNPGSVQQNLQSAINAARSWNSTSVFSRPQTNLVKEMASYCDSRPGSNLQLVTTTSTSGVQVFLDRDSADPTGFYARNATGIENFGVLLLDCAQVFNMRKDNIHIFYDQSGATIAFNSNGSLFCNYRFFAQLHQAGMQDAGSRSQATVYWWVVLCHELAHNLVADHSSDHSYYTEQFVAQYFASMMNLVARMPAARPQLEAAAAAAPEPSRRAENGVERAFS